MSPTTGVYSSRVMSVKSSASFFHWALIMMFIVQSPAVTLDYRTAAAPATRTRPGLRWWICGLLFAATTINYVDRQVIGVLKPTLQQELGWSEIDYSNIVFAFQMTYAAGYLFGGRLMDV